MTAGGTWTSSQVVAAAAGDASRSKQTQAPVSDDRSGGGLLVVGGCRTVTRVSEVEFPPGPKKSASPAQINAITNLDEHRDVVRFTTCDRSSPGGGTGRKP